MDQFPEGHLGNLVVDADPDDGNVEVQGFHWLHPEIRENDRCCGFVLKDMLTHRPEVVVAGHPVQTFAGDVAEVQTPGGRREYEILDVKYI